MFRKAYVTATIALMLVVMGAAMTGCPQDILEPYTVTIENLGDVEFNEVIAATHSCAATVFREGELASAALISLLTESTSTALEDALNSMDGVQEVYVAGQPLTAFNTLEFTIQGLPCAQLSLIAGPIGDPQFAGLDAIQLPRDDATRVYYALLYAPNDTNEVEALTSSSTMLRVTITKN